MSLKYLQTENTKHLYKICTMLCAVQMLYKCVVFAGPFRSNIVASAPQAVGILSLSLLTASCSMCNVVICLRGRRVPMLPIGPCWRRIAIDVSMKGRRQIGKLKGLAQAKIIKKSVILFRVLSMTI